MSIKFTKIGVRNFLSFGNVMEELDLTYDGTTLIAGDNVDQQSKNGAGKCVVYDTPINVRDKRTGEVFTLPIGEFYEKAVEIQRSKRKK